LPVRCTAARAAPHRPRPNPLAQRFLGRPPIRAALLVLPALICPISRVRATPPDPEPTLLLPCRS
jgi:hypothetical protein